MIPQARAGLRHDFVDRCYQVGGKDFVNAIAAFGVNERGEKLIFYPWVMEYAELLGDFRVAHILVSGSSQIGKTLINTLLLCYCITEGLNTLWAYDQQSSRDVQVQSNFRPVIRHWLKAKGIDAKRSQGVQNNSLYQVQGCDAQFTYVSTSKKRSDGGAAAGGAVVGVSRDILFKEERSQYPPGAGDPLNRRLDAGRLPSRPIRELGTPGSGGGIEMEIESADYQFYPHYTCTKCRITAPLNPKGCLLKPKEGKYLSPTGRPIDWHIIDGEAGFACANCGETLTRSQRENTFFQCTRTGITLRDYLDSLPPGIPNYRHKVGVILSPLLRIRETNAAQEIINEGLTTFNTDDWQQQGLGLPSESNTTCVTLDMLRSAIARQFTPTTQRIKLCGIDQGRNEYWLWKCEYHLPSGWQQLPMAQVLEGSYRVVLFGGDIAKGEVLERIVDCEYGIIDNEPDISAAASLCEYSSLEMGDQRSGQLDAVKEGIASEGGTRYKCWKFRNEKFLKSVLDGFVTQMYSLPEDWEQWLGKRTERSPFVHLTAPSYEPSSGKWNRPQNHIDDLYYAAMFCEVAFYIYLERYINKGEEAIASVPREIYRNISSY